MIIFLASCVIKKTFCTLKVFLQTCMKLRYWRKVFVSMKKVSGVVSKNVEASTYNPRTSSSKTLSANGDVQRITALTLAPVNTHVPHCLL